MMNIIDSLRYPDDNIGVMPFMLPDNKTFVFATDIPTYLKFDKNDLSTQGLLDIRKADFGQMMVGSTHMENDLTSSDMIGLGIEFGLSN